MNQDNSNQEFPYTGWIKKEVDESEDEFFIKEDMDGSPGSRFADLMNLSKDDLATRILQQEEEVRYLKDIRNDLQNNIRDLTSTCSSLKTLVSEMSSVISSLKDYQVKANCSISSPSESTPRAISVAEQSESNVMTTSGASSTDTSVVSSVKVDQSKASVSNVSSMKTPVSTAFKQQSKQNGFIPPVNSSTPIRQVYKAIPKGNTATKQIISPPTTSGLREQQSKANVPSSSSSGASVVSSGTSFREQQAKVNSATSGANAILTTSAATFKEQQLKSHYVVSTSNASATSTGTAMKDHHSVSKVSPAVPAANCAAATSHRSANKLSVTEIPASSSSSSSQPSVKTVADTSLFLSNLPKVPSGLTISIADPKKGNPRPNDRLVETSCDSISTTTKTVSAKGGVSIHRKSSSVTTKVLPTSSNSLPPSLNLPSGLSVNPVPEKRMRMTMKDEVQQQQIFSTSRNSPFENVIIKKEIEDEEEEEDSSEEVSILTPDLWAAQNRACRANVPQTVSAVQTVYVNQYFTNVSDRRVESEYISSPLLGDESENFEEPESDVFISEELNEYDIDENDTKEVYLAEDVTLPRQLVDACLRQGPTAAKLTRNLMTTLFPDLRELASSFVMGQPASMVKGTGQSPLPENKVNAIISLVQKTFPQCKRSSIIMAMNMKCKEAKKLLEKTSQQRSRMHRFQ